MYFESEVDLYGFSNTLVKNSTLVMKREEEVSDKANMPEAKGVKLWKWRQPFIYLGLMINKKKKTSEQVKTSSNWFLFVLMIV